MEDSENSIFNWAQNRIVDVLVWTGCARIQDGQDSIVLTSPGKITLLLCTSGVALLTYGSYRAGLLPWFKEKVSDTKSEDGHSCIHQQHYAMKPDQFAAILIQRLEIVKRDLDEQKMINRRASKPFTCYSPILEDVKRNLEDQEMINRKVSQPFTCYSPKLEDVERNLEDQEMINRKVSQPFSCYSPKLEDVERDLIDQEMINRKASQPLSCYSSKLENVKRDLVDREMINRKASQLYKNAMDVKVKRMREFFKEEISKTESYESDSFLEQITMDDTLPDTLDAEDVRELLHLFETYLKHNHTEPPEEVLEDSVDEMEKKTETECESPHHTVIYF